MDVPKQLTTVTPLSKALALIVSLGLLLLSFYLGANYQKRADSNSRLSESPPSPTPTVRMQTKFIPQPTVPPGVDKDNVYSNTVQFGFSFKHLDGYTVTNDRTGFSIRKIDPNDKYAPSWKDPNSMAISFVKYSDTRADKSIPYTQEDIYKWIKTWVTGDQCFHGSSTSETVIRNKTFYKIENTCGAEKWYKIHYIYLLELHKRNGDFLRIDTFDSPQSEQMNLFLDTFSLIN